MAWNIQHGGNNIENSPKQVIQIIKEMATDVILMVVTYGIGQMVAGSPDYFYHLIAEEGTWSLSRSFIKSFVQTNCGFRIFILQTMKHWFGIIRSEALITVSYFYKQLGYIIVCKLWAWIFDISTGI